jgi:hypothetical protein
MWGYLQIISNKARSNKDKYKNTYVVRALLFPRVLDLVTGFPALLLLTIHSRFLFWPARWVDCIDYLWFINIAVLENVIFL